MQIEGKTTADLIKAIRELATGDPDFVYQVPGLSPACRYAHEGKASCIVGQAFHSLGVPIEEIELWDPSTLCEPSGFRHGLTLMDIIDTKLSLPEQAWSSDYWWVSYVQNNQDSGWSWGAAVRMADEKWANENADSD